MQMFVGTFQLTIGICLFQSLQGGVAHIDQSTSMVRKWNSHRDLPIYIPVYTRRRLLVKDLGSKMLGHQLNWSIEFGLRQFPNLMMISIHSWQENYNGIFCPSKIIYRCSVRYGE